MLKKITALLFLSIAFYGLSQQKVLDHTVYNDWKSVTRSILSPSGQFASFEINPHRGDGYLHWVNTETKQRDSIIRGKNAQFSQQTDVLLFSIDPGYDTIRQLELKKVKKEERVRDSLGIWYLSEDSLIRLSNLIDFKSPEKGYFTAYRRLSDSVNTAPIVEKKKCRLFGKKKEEVTEISSKGEVLFIHNLKSGDVRKIENVVAYSFNKTGKVITYTTHKEVEKEDSFKLNILDLEKGIIKTEKTNFTTQPVTNFNSEGDRFLFVASTDTGDVKQNNLYVWELNKNEAQRYVHAERSELNGSLHVSENYTPWFSEDNTKIFLGLIDIPEEEVEDTLLDKEKAKLDIWHYQNNRLQPQQLLEKKRDERSSYLTVLHLGKNQLVQLENDTLKVRPAGKGNANTALAYSNEPYAFSYNWNYPWPSDYYSINLETGETKPIKRNVDYAQGISPDGKYFIYFESDSNNYYFQELSSGNVGCITCFTKDTVNWKRDINGMPHKAGPIGIVGFSGPEELILHDKFDIWSYNFTGRRLSCITKGKGRFMNTELRLKRWDYDSVYIDLNQTYIHATHQDTYDESIYKYVENQFDPHLVFLYETNHRILGVNKAEEGEQILFRQMNVKDYPDVFLSNTSFENPQQLSVANPQQSEYIWPTLEQVSWTSYEGRKLKGLLYKPENFDTTKNYPMLVYFYELYSGRKHNHYIPKPTASIIYPTEYTSAGYVVFIPDVRYTPGHPAKSAYDCIMSGTDHVLSLYPNIDSTKLGLQGQSWGGYQTAQLITMTNRYSAAMAGAPVSNMFSAYGGIRWGSGLNRAFQYERTQSRIGKTIWEAPELYVENSPLFGVPNIETPLLIMHNDGDGAVPWYQGIEMFTAMKRLNKPVWMLNYNGDEHNLMKNANRMDLSIRMRQFFDHYLKGAPAPEWLVKGIPATEKGENYGLEEYKED